MKNNKNSNGCTTLIIIIAAIITIPAVLFKGCFHVADEEVKAGDKVYVKPMGGEGNKLELCLKATPVTEEQIDNFTIEEWQKKKLKNLLKEKKLEPIVFKMFYLEEDELYKNHTANIGTYLGKPKLLSENTFSLPEEYVAIKLNDIFQPSQESFNFMNQSFNFSTEYKNSDVYNLNEDTVYIDASYVTFQNMDSVYR